MSSPRPSIAPAQRPLLAIALALGAAAVLPVVDAMVKVLVAEYPVVLVAWARMGLIALFLGVSGYARLGARMWRPAAPALQVARGLCAVLGTSMVFLGFRHMPLAECLAIVSVAPLAANAFSRWWLGEAGTRRTWGAAGASFAGVLLIVRPGLGVFDDVAVFPAVGALGLAGFLTLTRALAHRDPPELTAFFGPAVAFAAFSCAVPGDLAVPRSVADAGLFVAIGALAAVAQVLQAHAYRYGSTHVVAPIGYSSLAFAVAIGWGVFGRLPDAWSWAGLLMIGGAGAASVLIRR